MSESKSCGCRIVFDGDEWSILYCPLHEAAPDGLKLAEAVLAIAGPGVHDWSTVPMPPIPHWLDIIALARRVVEAAEPKEPRT